MKDAWVNMSEAVPYLTDFFRSGRKLEDNDIIYFLETTTDYVYSLEQQVEGYRNQMYVIENALP
jgi:hypothetical protein